MYNGQYGVATDDNGLYYMRARYYNVDIKRFINQDVVVGGIDRTSSLNRYSYVEGNPVSYLDPFGLEPKKGNTLFHKFLHGLEIGLAVAAGAVVIIIGGELAIAVIGILGLIGLFAASVDVGAYTMESYYYAKEKDYKSSMNTLEEAKSGTLTAAFDYGMGGIHPMLGNITYLFREFIKTFKG